jgi:hypothetical protein
MVNFLIQSFPRVGLAFLMALVINSICFTTLIADELEQHLSEINETDADNIRSKRLPPLLISAGLVYGGSIYALNKAWYQGHERGSFHFQDDFTHWKQMDKFGHAFTTYWSGFYGNSMLQWAAVEREKAIWYGGSAGLLVTIPIEIMDGFSKKWGFSLSDMAANFVGTAMFIGQELILEEQRYQLKLTYSPSGLSKYRPNLLGSNFAEELLKDYNGQTYWLSFPLEVFFKNEGNKIPNWLNIAIGYSGQNMLGATSNPVYVNDIELPELERYRQFYLSPDINFLRLTSELPWLNMTFKAVAFIKVPAPAIEYNKINGFEFHWIHF